MDEPVAARDAGKAAAPPAPRSAFAPFHNRVFAVLWVATVLSNVGTWVHDVAAGWLMTSLSPSPLMVALVQTATSLPIFLFALPAGALADIVDRRRLLAGVQTALAVVAGALGLLVLAGWADPWLLLGFTFCMGTGAALLMPTWQAIVPSLVARDTLQQAVALNSIGVNISRAVGPALAGLIITAIGIAVPFLVNAASYLVVIAAVLWWRPAVAAQRRLPPEHLFSGMRAGLRYAWASGPLRATLGRAVGFFVFASAYWALLPLVVRKLLDGDAKLYGALLGCVGVGAVLCALALPRIRGRLGPDHLVRLGTLGMAIVLVVVGLFSDRIVAAGASLLAGASWIVVLTSLNVSAQTALPDWVRARGLSVFVMIFFGSMSAGSVIWGQTASQLGLSAALLIAAAGALVAIPLTWRWRLHGARLDVTPSMHWPEPMVDGDVAHDRGPVMVTVEYRIDPAQAAAFVAALDAMSGERRRDGAYAWGLFEDAAVPGRYIESFLVASWLEHLRQHERVTAADRDIEERARQFLLEGTEPIVTHLIAPKRGD